MFLLYLNTNVDIKLSAHDAFWNNFIRYAQYKNIGKPNNLFGGNKPNGLNRISNPVKVTYA